MIPTQRSSKSLKVKRSLKKGKTLKVEAQASKSTS